MTPILEFVIKNYKNFNSRATRDALIAYWKHIDEGGKMFWAMAGAMSSAHSHHAGPAIRKGLVHGLSSRRNLQEPFSMIAPQLQGVSRLRTSRSRMTPGFSRTDARVT